MKIKDNFYDFNFKSEEKFVKVRVILFQYQGGPKVVGLFSLGYNFKSFNHTKPKF